MEVVLGFLSVLFLQTYSHYKELHESPKLLHLRGQRGGGGVQGGCLTVMLHSQDLGGLLVAERST